MRLARALILMVIALIGLAGPGLLTRLARQATAMLLVIGVVGLGLSIGWWLLQRLLGWISRRLSMAQLSSNHFTT